MKRLLITILLLSLGAVAQAVPVALTSSIQCSAGNQQNGIAISDVTGNNGGATDCWGTYNGNDPGPSGDGYTIGTDAYSFVAKQNTPGAHEGANIGLVVSPADGSQQSGTWAFNQGALGGHNFLIVLKQANNPGYAVWLFSGSDAASYSGAWQVAWSPGLSHLSIYKGPMGDDPGGEAPVPATAWLIGTGLVLVRLGRRKR